MSAVSSASKREVELHPVFHIIVRKDESVGCLRSASSNEIFPNADHAEIAAPDRRDIEDADRDGYLRPHCSKRPAQ